MPDVISLLLLFTIPVQASPIKFADVVNVMGDLHKGGQIGQLRRAARSVPATNDEEESSVAAKSAEA